MLAPVCSGSFRLSRMCRQIVIISILALLTLQFCKYLMAGRALSSSIHSMVYVTVPNATVATELARSIVKKKLAACVSILPGVTSIYEWKGEIEESSEHQLLIKTKTSALDSLKTHVLSMHPYETPEFIAVPIEYGSEDYLKWINEQVNDVQ